MSSPARYWIVVFAFAAVLCACAGRSGAPLPFVPQASVLAGVDQPLDSPDAARCATDTAQPGWVFRGVCKYVRNLHSGKAIAMPVYAGFTVTWKIPRNNAGTQKIIVAVANENDIAARKGRHRLGPFPSNKDAFLYFKTVDPGLPIRFRKATKIEFDLTNGGTPALGTPCAIDTLQKSGGKFVWKTLPVAGTISGKLLTYSVPQSHYATIPHGAAYYAFLCQKAPTPSPSPSSKPTPTPKPTATPAYCANFSAPPTPNVPIYVKDNSGLGASVIAYVWNGTSWMTNAGAFGATSANPIPLDCFPGTTGSSGKTFAVPTGLAASRLYISFAVPASTTVVPNPLASMPPGGPALVYGNAYWSVPWDVVKFGTTNGAVVDLTAVTDLGLPLELAQSLPGALRVAHDQHPMPNARPTATPRTCATAPAGTVGVTACGYASIYSAMSALPQYQNLVATGPFNGKIIDLRIINPAKTQGAFNFGLDWFYNPAYMSPYPAACSGVATPLTYGYLSCLLAAYQTQSRLYATVGSGATKVTGHNYCVSSDGSANFGFTDVGSASTCTGITYSSPNTHAMPIALFTYGTPPLSKDGTGCDAGFLFGLPPNNGWITSGKSGKNPNVFATADAFAVWKALAIDINRGAALSTGAHPAGGWAQNFTSPAPFTDYYGDPVYNSYAYVLHRYFDHHQSYALSYDEPGGQASAFTYVSGNALDLTVNPVPTAAAVSPASTPVPYPTPFPCSVFPTNVGG